MSSVASARDGRATKAFPIRNAATSDAPMRLFCFPFAGGNTSVFRPWLNAFDGLVDVCPVELAGRGLRYHDPLAPAMPELVADVLATLEAECDRPFALFGHSMGAAVAFAVALAMDATTHGPRAVFVSAAPAPTDGRRRRLATLDEDELRASLRRLGGIPPAVDRYPELLELLMPLIRADIAVVEEWTPPPCASIDAPLVAFGGMDDPFVSDAALDNWARYTRGGFHAERVPGGHFYVTTEPQPLIERVKAHLVRVAELGRPAPDQPDAAATIDGMKAASSPRSGADSTSNGGSQR